jgi:hypothetical protein
MAALCRAAPWALGLVVVLVLVGCQPREVPKPRTVAVPPMAAA